MPAPPATLRARPKISQMTPGTTLTKCSTALGGLRAGQKPRGPDPAACLPVRRRGWVLACARVAADATLVLAAASGRSVGATGAVASVSAPGPTGEAAVVSASELEPDCTRAGEPERARAVNSAPIEAADRSAASAATEPAT